MKKFFLLGSIFIIAALILVNFPTLAQNDSKSRGQIRAASVQGLVKINGQDVIVEVLVAIQPGEDPQATARAVLLRAYPNARPFDSAQFRTTGFFWDVFSDANPGNNFVTVNYNPSGVPGNLSNPRDVWLSAQNTWTDVATSNFVYRDGGNTSRCPSLVKECPGSQYFDGYNDIGWLDIADPSVLGVTWYGTTRDEFDMALDNRNFSWYTGDPGSIPYYAYDTQTVWLHELGHGLGLDHSNIEGAVMEPYYEGVRRAPHQDDIDGISSLYPASASPTPTPTPTPTPAPSSTPSPTPTPSPSAVCWSGSNQYLYRSSSQAQKFCKCAQGTYGYNSYSYFLARKTVYSYSDSSNNENWSVSSRSSFLPISSVTCTDGLAYPTNQNYFWPK